MDRPTFDRLALEHLDAVYRMAMQLARQPDEAADLVQETYVKAIRAAGGFEERGGGVRSWLFKILHNVFYSRRDQAKRRPVTVEDLDGAGEGPIPGQPGPAWNLAEFEWEHVDGRLKLAIEALRPEYRSILLLWGVEGMKYREIAEIQQIPIGTVMSRLFRARSMLAHELSDLAEEMRVHRGSTGGGRAGS